MCYLLSWTREDEQLYFIEGFIEDKVYFRKKQLLSSDLDELRIILEKELGEGTLNVVKEGPVSYSEYWNADGPNSIFYFKSEEIFYPIKTFTYKLKNTVDLAKP